MDESGSGKGTESEEGTGSADEIAGTDESEPIEKTLGDLLTERGETLATAESLTGGLVGSRVTEVPGASAYFDRGFVTYAYDAKRELLGVSRESLDAEGAVSAAVAEQMAAGARDHADTTWAVATTESPGRTAAPRRSRSDSCTSGWLTPRRGGPRRRSFARSGSSSTATAAP